MQQDRWCKSEPLIERQKFNGPRRPPKANLLNASRPDRASPIAARAPEGFITDRGPRALDQGSGKVAGKVWIVDRVARSAKLLI